MGAAGRGSASQAIPIAVLVLTLLVALSLGATLGHVDDPAAESATKSSPPRSAGNTALNVQGNRLVDSGGREVILHGVNRMGFEYSCVQNKGLFDAPLDRASVEAIRSWNVNAVRLPLNEHCWLGIDGTPSGEPYRRGVESYVRLLLEGGMYVILDLHWSAAGGSPAATQAPMPNVDHSADFWGSVADRFKGDDRILFDLFNEPTPNRNRRDLTEEAARRSWQCWRDGSAGGTCDTVQLNGMAGTQVLGMQALVEAVRATGATNVLMLGGTRFANTLSSSSTRGWLSYKPVDPLNKLAASWHVYNDSPCMTVSCYESEIAPLAAQVPVIAGEVGNDQCDAEWLTSLLRWLDEKKIGYLAWVWNTWLSGDCASRALIVDHRGTPSAYGEIYRAHLAELIPSSGR
jgi:endoglucanase